jgi:hypothetical protein
MGDAVRDAPSKMGYQDSSSPTPVAYRRGCGHFAGKPLALGEKLCHPSLTTLAAIEQAIAGIALALGSYEMLCWPDVKTTKSNNIGLMAEAIGDVVGGYRGLMSRQR